MTDIIDNNRGKIFPPPAIFAGYIFIVIGLIALIDKSIVGLGVTIIGVIASFTSTGIQLDIKNKQYKEYTNFLGLKFGQWKSLDNYPYLAILNKTLGFKAYSRGQVELNDHEKYFDICLLNRTHRQKLVIKRLSDKEQATVDAKELADKLGVQLTVYNPVISDRTRARR